MTARGETGGGKVAITECQRVPLRRLARAGSYGLALGGDRQIGVINTAKALIRRGLVLRYAEGLLYTLTDEGRDVANGSPA